MKTWHCKLSRASGSTASVSTSYSMCANNPNPPVYNTWNVDILHVLRPFLLSSMP